MIALAALLFLALEAVAYTGLAVWLIGSRHAAIVPALLGIAAIPVCIRVALALPSFVVASAIRARRGIATRAGDTWTALAKEIWAKSCSYTFNQPFERWAMPPEPASGERAHIPVLLVHGYVCNRGVWYFMLKMLKARVPNVFHTISLEPPFCGIDDYVPKLAQRIEQICTAGGAAQVVIVAHSMGGLIARRYLSAGNAGRVAALVTIGSPHRGTEVARFGVGHNVRQMRYGNEWLEELARREATQVPGVPLTSIYTENDDLVCPADSSRLGFAKNIALRRVGHVSLLLSAEVADLVAAELSQVNAAQG